jgi:3-oxoadipate enol-lactonase
MPSLPPAIDLNTTRRGSGPLLVGLHDIGASSVAMQSALRPLSRRHRVIAPDLRGHGGSPTPKGPWSVDDFSSDVARLIAEEGGSAVVVGVGLGAATAVSLALGHPARVEGLVLTGLAAKPESAERAERWLQMAGELRDGGAEGLALSAEAFARRPDWRRSLAQVSAETIVVTGSDDRSVDPTGQRELAMWFPNARFVDVPDVGHDLLRAAPQELVAAVRALGDDATTVRHAA